jgi:arginase
MVHIISCCCHSGQKKLGTELAPNLIINKIITKYPHFNISYHNINKDDFIDNSGYQTLYNINKNILQPTISLGGDHSIGISTVMASFYKYKNNLKVIWVDAHADINTNKTSPSQNKHGMPISPMFNLMESWVNFDDDQYYPNPSQIIYIGLRSVDDGEKEIIKNLKIKAYYNTDVINLGIDKIMDEILGENLNDTQYHLSFDIDALDPKYAPSTGTTENYGLTLNQGNEIVSRLIKTNNLKSYDLVEFNPNIGSKDDVELTTDTCINLIEPYLLHLNS